MTIDAQAAKLAQAKQLIISPVRHDVIRDRRHRHAAGLQTSPVQRLDPELIPSPAQPFAPIVPAMNVTFVRHGRTIACCTFDRYST